MIYHYSARKCWTSEVWQQRQGLVSVCSDIAGAGTCELHLHIHYSRVLDLHIEVNVSHIELLVNKIIFC